MVKCIFHTCGVNVITRSENSVRMQCSAAVTLVCARNAIRKLHGLKSLLIFKNALFPLTAAKSCLEVQQASRL